jgi:hypothetical protein
MVPAIGSRTNPKIVIAAHRARRRRELGTATEVSPSVGVKVYLGMVALGLGELPVIG